MPRVSLKSPSHVKRYLARLILKVEKGEIDPSIAGRIGYLCNVLIRSMEVADIDERLSEIENLLSEKVKRP